MALSFKGYKSLDMRGAFLTKGIRSAILFGILFLISAYQSYAQTYGINQRTKIYAVRDTLENVTLSIDNDFYVPISIQINVSLSNLNLTFDSISAIIPPKAAGFKLATYKKLIGSEPYKCEYRYRVVLGDTTKIVNHNYVYGYPYLRGLSYRISQGPGGSFSHKHSFAYDFAMPKGTAVTASREGIVAALKFNSSIGGPDEQYLPDANFISILHSDGTIANYLHLNPNGVNVKEGDIVERGEVIGYSGNTGYSTGPHLHFEVIKPSLSPSGRTWVEFEWEKPLLYGFFPADIKNKKITTPYYKKKHIERSNEWFFERALEKFRSLFQTS
ncbi:M23 family metallopeptidase [Desertivirga brevis]|uniref:M23 family metallopeptidase n=1 Tax=Desertivirga brevis TaxID=2810310 RepID=UPI001A95AAFE|nr:M23 family metallopeptidase [Pedobacter sp. SYSU D00873]